MAWVKQRAKTDGTPYWCVFFRELDHETGKTRQASLSWDNPADADQARQLIDDLGPAKAREILKIVQAPARAQTLAQYLSKYIDHLTGTKPGTPKKYRSYLRNDMQTIGTIPLTALTSADVARWINAMNQPDASGARPSGKTIANKHGFLAGALNAAVRQGVIKSNPCESTRLPRWDRKEMVFLERDEFKILLQAVPEYWRPLVEFLVSSGCRWSEATALKPAAVNVAAGTVRITKAWEEGEEGGYEYGVPKTQKSVRTINVPKRVLEQLDLSGEWVFTNSGRGKGQFADGMIRDDPGPVRIHSFHPNVWTPAIDRAQAEGLTKRPRIHDLRHTCASWLIAAGIPMNVVQRHLGHESITTTVDRYSHVDRHSARAAADAMGRILGG